MDGWTRIINDNPNCDGIQFSQDDESATCTIYRKDRSHPTVVTEYLAECKMNTDPWKKYPKRMLRHKALIQCARVAFGYSGIYDEDEAHRINSGQANTMTDVEPASDDYMEFYNEQQPILLEAAYKGMDELMEAHKALNALDNKEVAKRLWAESSPRLKEIAQKADMKASDEPIIEEAEVVTDEPTTTA